MRRVNVYETADGWRWELLESEDAKPQFSSAPFINRKTAINNAMRNAGNAMVYVNGEVLIPSINIPEHLRKIEPELVEVSSLDTTEVETDDGML